MQGRVIGHRGCKGEEPENTLRGIRNALDLGADGVEVDVHLSKDGKVVVIHDETVDRTTNGKGFVKDIEYKKLARLDAGKGEKIPLLSEVIDAVRKHDKELVIEIKCRNAEEKVMGIVKGKDYVEKSIVISFDHRIVKKVKKICPSIRTGCLLVGLPVHAYKLIEDANADMLSVNADTVDNGLIKECHRKGYKVMVWNVDERKEFLDFKKMGADYIGTNVPSVVLGRVNHDLLRCLSSSWA